MNAHCRIARVRPKASPRLTVYVLPDDGGLKPEFARQCEMVSEAVDGPMTGYAVVAWNSRGSVTTQFQVSGPPYHQAQVPSLVRDILRRHDVIELVHAPAP